MNDFMIGVYGLLFAAFIFAIIMFRLYVENDEFREDVNEAIVYTIEKVRKPKGAHFK